MSKIKCFCANLPQQICLFWKQNWWRILSIIALLAFGICSVSVFANYTTNPQSYKNTIQSIDEKKVTVLGVSAAIAGSATLLAAIPDDSTTPLAEEMMDLSSYLVIVVCILVLEKSLLTVFGAVSCYALIPLACALFIACLIKYKRTFMAWGVKISILALALLFLVPGAMKLSDYIYEVNQVTIEQEVEEIVNDTNAEAEEDLPWYKKLWNGVSNAVESTVDKALDSGKKALNQFIDAVSVFIIAYCAVPIVIVLLFFWLAKYLFNLNVHVENCSLVSISLIEKQKEKTNTMKTRTNSYSKNSP